MSGDESEQQAGRPEAKSRRVSKYETLRYLLLDGKKIKFPEHRVETFAKAERKTKTEQGALY